MDNRDRVHGNDTGFVTLFARAPQLCAATLAGLGSALWLNVVGPFAGFVAAWGSLVLVNVLAIAVVAILAMLVTTAGTLLAADWRADAPSRQAWAGIDVAAAELRLRPESVALSQVDPRYLAATSEALPSVFRPHRFASSAPVVEAGTEASGATRIVVAVDGPNPPIVASEAAPNIARKISTAAASEVAMAHSPCRNAARAAPGQELLVVASCRARPRVFRAETAAIKPRLVVNGAWSERLAHHRCVLTGTPLERHVADIVVLSGDRGDRDQRERTPDPSARGSVVGSVEPPNCRGPPSVVGQRPAAREMPPAKLLVGGGSQVQTASTLPTGDPVVVDDLGHPVPVCAAELDVIETYLGRALQDLLGPGASVPDREKS